jgi:hypothetical protein
VRLAQKTELRIAGSVRQARIHSTRYGWVVTVHRLIAPCGWIHPSWLPRAAGLCNGPVPALLGVAGLDLACLCRRPGQLHLSLVRTRRSGTLACFAPSPSYRWSSWLLVLAARGPGGRRRRPPQAWPEADAGLGHGPAPFGCLAGRSVLPLEPGDGGHRGMPTGRQGQAMEPTKSARLDQVAEWARLGCRVGWWGACGWGSGMPAPSGQIPPPWAWWENEAPAARAACSSSQAQVSRWSLVIPSVAT